MTCASISELPLRPETGTFVSMDSYAGTLDNPVSLHKYLYANANPVMYVDPSGNFSLMETSIAQGIQATISDLIAPGLTMKKVMTWANLIVTTYDVVQQARLIFAGEANIAGLAWAVAKGIGMQMFMNCVFTPAIGETLNMIFKVVGVIGDAKSLAEAVKSGDPEKIFIESLRFAVAVYTLKCQCFTEDTLVSTIDGDRPIGELEAGDKVWAYNTETGENEEKAITAVIVTETDVIVHVKTSDGEDIETTMFHPFYVRHSDKESGGSVYDGEWKAASNLLAGDVLQKIDGSTVYVTEVTVEKLPEIINVYNLEIEDLHTYYVADGVLVHNQYENDSSPKVDETSYGKSSSKIGDFSNLEGSSVDDILDRIPDEAVLRDLKPVEGGATEGFEFKWVSNEQTYRVRVHNADPSAPKESNANNGWIVRIQRGRQFFDPTINDFREARYFNNNGPYFDETIVNNTHIPIKNPYGN